MRLLIAFLTLLPAAALAECGGSWSAFKAGLVAEAPGRGIEAGVAERFLSGVRQDQAVLRADRAQGVFQRPFIDFSRRLISQNRIDRGRQMAQRHAGTFDRVERDFGVDRNVLLAFWAFETDYGSFQGDFNTANALVTLAHDCRRPALFRPQVFAAMELFARGQFDPARTTGAWAGEIGMVQMLPADIIENGVDGDGDGRVDLKGSATDALLSGGRMLAHLGWRAGEPWLQEVTVPAQMDWSLSGLGTVKPAAAWQALGVAPRAGRLADLPASLILPQGHKGPAFLAYP
ncbi:MAG: lytic murein transglycosylase, partial [Pseudomonadota bacterium]